MVLSWEEIGFWKKMGATKKSSPNGDVNDDFNMVESNKHLFKQRQYNF